MTSELVTNSVKHSRSRRAGGTITVTVTPGANRVQVQVQDEGADTVPTLRRSAGSRGDDPPHPPGFAGNAGSCADDDLPAWLDDELEECGRGLRLVDAYALTWGYYRTEDGTITWFECLSDPLP